MRVRDEDVVLVSRDERHVRTIRTNPRRALERTVKMRHGGAALNRIRLANFRLPVVHKVEPGACRLPQHGFRSSVEYGAFRYSSKTMQSTWSTVSRCASIQT